MQCTHPQDKANRMYNPRTEKLKDDEDTVKAASKHNCMEPVSTENKEWLWVHEDRAHLNGVVW